MIGKESEKTGVCYLPVNPGAPPNNTHIDNVEVTGKSTNIEHDAANSMYMLSYKQQQLKQMHQVFCNLPIVTLEMVIKNNQLTGVPCMKSKLVRKYLAPSPATPKGGMSYALASEAQEGNKKMNNTTTVRLKNKEKMDKIMFTLM